MSSIRRLHGSVIPKFAFMMFQGEPLSIFCDGEQTRDFMNVRDVVQANIKAAVTVGTSGAFHLGGVTRVTVNRQVDWLPEAPRLSPIVRYGPSRGGDVRHSRSGHRQGAARSAWSPPSR